VYLKTVQATQTRRRKVVEDVIPIEDYLRLSTVETTRETGAQMKLINAASR